MANRKSKRISDEEYEASFPANYTPPNNSKFSIEKLNIDFKFKNINQKKFVHLIIDNKITVAAGPAGTGKTYLACAQALKLLKSDSRFRRIILVKSVTVLEGEEVGFLKGDIKEKMFPYTISFLDNFHKLIGEANTQIMMDQGIIQVLPLAYIRGRSIDHCMLPGTLINMDDNTTIKIEDLFDTYSTKFINDDPVLIKAFNFNESKVVTDELDSISRQPITGDVFEITMDDGRVMKLTAEHRLHVVGKGYVEVQHILPNDELTNM